MEMLNLLSWSEMLNASQLIKNMAITIPIPDVYMY